MPSDTNEDRQAALSPCGRCGEDNQHMRVEDLCFDCWYIERGAEDPDKLFAVVNETARQRHTYKNERNALVAAFIEMGAAMEVMGKRLAEAHVSIGAPDVV